MVSEEAKTMMNNSKSSKIDKALFSGARIKIADRYWAKTIIGILYPLTTENKLMNFITNSLCCLLNILKLINDFQLVIFQ